MVLTILKTGFNFFSPLSVVVFWNFYTIVCYWVLPKTIPVINGDNPTIIPLIKDISKLPHLQSDIVGNVNCDDTVSASINGCNNIKSNNGIGIVKYFVNGYF